jgi:predicted transcriptional regulator
MKAIQIMLDEDLLAQLDETAEVREKGRSAVLREV